jgi:hypothetical protein
MILLTSTSDLLRVVTGSALDVDVHASWVDNDAGDITPGRTNTAITTATTTTVVTSPGASVQRNVQTLTVTNKDASPCDITVVHYDGSVTSQLVKVALPAGYTLTYSEGIGFQVIQTDGSIRTAGAQGDQGVQGPQGDQGDQGPQGDPGTNIITKLTIWVPAAAMVAKTTAGAAAAVRETTTNDVMLRTMNFADSGADTGAQFQVGMPKGWDEGTVTFIPYWTATSGSGNVIFGMRAVAVSNDDTLDAAFGTAQTSTDTLLATGDLHIGPESAAITIAGTPQENDLVTFEVYRDGDNGSDTFSGTAELIGVKVIYTVSTPDDA